MNNIIITGGAGFIGSTLCDNLLEDEHNRITVIDNFDNFYSREIKENNVKHNLGKENYRLVEADFRHYDVLEKELTEDYNMIIHLAAKAGVRPSIINPIEYQQVNVQGTQNLLEFAKEKGINKFVFGSSSSVYGINPNVPWSEDDFVLQPISPYAATKVAGELLGHVYHNLYGIQFIALRFFTVYGPRQRPDLAIHKFFEMIHNDKPIPVFGDGSTRRDYTYVDDIVSGILAAMDYNKTGYEVINIGNNDTVSLSDLITAIEKVIGKKAVLDRQELQAGDVPQTYANISKAGELLGYQPSTKLEEGLKKFWEWKKEKL